MLFLVYFFLFILMLDASKENTGSGGDFSLVLIHIQLITKSKSIRKA